MPPGIFPVNCQTRLPIHNLMLIRREYRGVLATVTEKEVK